MLTETERAYLAGILDGEGCVSVATRLKKYLTPIVQVTNTRLELLDWLHVRYGGSVLARPDKRQTRKPSYAWVVCGQKALHVLRDARPYLLLKTQQADLVLALPRQSTKQRDALGRIKGCIGPAEIAANVKLIGQIRALNQRGVSHAS